MSLYLYMDKKLLIGIIFSLSLLGYANSIATPSTYHDYRATNQSNDLVQMQNYHLQQAEQKMSRNQPSYAWGDFAYLLCYVPNHHIALKQMLNLASELHKQTEMKKFFENALQAYPEDSIVYALYAAFYFKNSDQTNADKYMDIALKLNPELAEEFRHPDQASRQ